MNATIVSNKRIGWFVGPDTTIADWEKPSLANVQALTNYSPAIRTDGTDFGLQATEMTDDRSFADEAGAQALGYSAFGGNVSSFIPAAADTASVVRQAHTTFKKPRTKLAVAQRFGVPEAQPIAAGDEINLFRVITDAENVERRQTGYSTTTELVDQDDHLVNYIVPPAVAASVTVTGASGGAVGSVGLLAAEYQGHAITVGAQWVSSNPAVATVHPGGVVEYLSAGTAQITAAYPGAATSANKAITVTV
ncbi:hypothetical protein BKA24_001807 [Microbacterium marinum]|uniref:BIG2 domain-containing protein n=1 Tax=Microbacterium marinum TaxID=421115 RepID=A0A7W7BSW2_9MICO|nr:hypothetical protein [Microbacterium marinum]MBB4667098.1 hypothetical protein [Microbacterium marinum]